MYIPKISYHDFYKFVVSAGTAILIVSIVLITYLNLQLKELLLEQRLILLSPWLIILSLSTITVGWALKKWYVNQKKIDTILDTKYRESLKKNAEIDSWTAGHRIQRKLAKLLADDLRRKGFDLDEFENNSEHENGRRKK